MSSSPAGNWSRQVSRKSLRAPWALVNGMVMGTGWLLPIDLPPVNLDGRRSFYLNPLRQFIVRAVRSDSHHRLCNFISGDCQYPLFAKKQIGAQDRGVP